MFVVSRKKYDRALQQAAIQVDQALKKIKILEEEKNVINTTWQKEKVDLLEKNANLNAEKVNLEKTIQNSNILINDLDTEIAELSVKNFELKSSKGGLISAITRQKKKIDRLTKENKELKKSMPIFNNAGQMVGRYKLKVLREQKTPKVKCNPRLKNSKNSQVKAQLKSIGDENGQD